MQVAEAFRPPGCRREIGSRQNLGVTSRWARVAALEPHRMEERVCRRSYPIPDLPMAECQR